MQGLDKLAIWQTSEQTNALTKAGYYHRPYLKNDLQHQ